MVNNMENSIRGAFNPRIFSGNGGLGADLNFKEDTVRDVANNVKRINDELKSSFSNVTDAINALDRSWDGEAASNAITKFNTIKSNFVENRPAQVDVFVSFLLRQVGDGYVSTEEVNKQLADQFK